IAIGTPSFASARGSPRRCRRSCFESRRDVERLHCLVSRRHRWRRNGKVIHVWRLVTNALHRATSILATIPIERRRSVVEGHSTASLLEEAKRRRTMRRLMLGLFWIGASMAAMDRAAIAGTYEEMGQMALDATSADDRVANAAIDNLRAKGP